MFPEVPDTSNMSEKLPSAETIRVGATIRAMREMRGLTVDEMANALLISRPYLANIEAGRKRLQPELAAKIARLLVVRQIAILRPDEFPADLQEAS